MQVVELEEVLSYKMLAREGKEGWQSECNHLRTMWTKRLRGVQAYIYMYRRMLTYADVC
jgi:hypothetical protein